MPKQKTTWNERLRKLREETGLSQAGFARDYVGINAAQYCVYESKGVTPQMETFIELVKALEVAFADLVPVPLRAPDLAAAILFG